MNPADYAHVNRTYRAPKPFTPEDAARAREDCYRAKGWSERDYRFPFMAELLVISDGQTIPLLSPFIGGAWHKAVLARIRRMDYGKANVQIYATVPSMANVPKRDDKSGNKGNTQESGRT